MDEKFFETKNNTYAQRKTNKYCIMLLKTAISTCILGPLYNQIYLWKSSLNARCVAHLINKISVTNVVKGPCFAYVTLLTKLVSYQRSMVYAAYLINKIGFM